MSLFRAWRPSAHPSVYVHILGATWRFTWARDVQCKRLYRLRVEGA